MIDGNLLQTALRTFDLNGRVTVKLLVNAFCTQGQGLLRFFVPVVVQFFFGLKFFKPV